MSRDVTQVGSFALWITKRLRIVALLEDGKDGEVDLGFLTSWRAVHLDSLLFFLYLRSFPTSYPLFALCTAFTITSISSSNRSFVGKIEIEIYVGCHWAQVGVDTDAF